jgi:hypothetical protein
MQMNAIDWNSVIGTVAKGAAEYGIAKQQAKIIESL